MLLKKLPLYENRITKAEYKKMDGENYKVTMTVETKKIYYDGLGKRKERDRVRI